jgi:hypothetical protein
MDVRREEREVEQLRDAPSREPHPLGELALIADGAVAEESAAHRVRQREHLREAGRDRYRTSYGRRRNSSA